jgi:hypothetical protein
MSSCRWWSDWITQTADVDVRLFPWVDYHSSQRTHYYFSFLWQNDNVCVFCVDFWEFHLPGTGKLKRVDAHFSKMCQFCDTHSLEWRPMSIAICTLREFTKVSSIPSIQSQKIGSFSYPIIVFVHFVLILSNSDLEVYWRNQIHFLTTMKSLRVTICVLEALFSF